jgi:hypothetical protein
LCNPELIEEQLRANVPTDSRFFKGFVRLFIEYFNHYEVPGVSEKILNPYPEEFRELVLYCLKFLLMDKNDEFSFVKRVRDGSRSSEDKKRSSLDHTKDPNYRYIALNSFIYKYLKIPDNDDGYSYVVMQYLQNTYANEVFSDLWNDEFIDHGSGIRCAWLKVCSASLANYPGTPRDDGKGEEYLDKVMEITAHINGEDIKRVMFAS